MSREDPVWARPEPGERKPSHSREQIVRKAIEIADAEGYDAVSMRRIAHELGAGTMTLYHYVRTKDELITLIGDAIMGEIVIPDDELPDGWREGMAEISRRTYQMFARHPWVVEHLGEGDPNAAGPNVLRHIEQTIAVASRTGLDDAELFELSGILDDYVFGHAIRNAEDPLHGTDGDTQSRIDTMLSYITAQLDTGDYPHLRAMFGGDPRVGFARMAELAGDEQRFERGLQRLLDGLELWIEGAKKKKRKQR